MAEIKKKVLDIEIKGFEDAEKKMADYVKNMPSILRLPSNAELDKLRQSLQDVTLAVIPKMEEINLMNSIIVKRQDEINILDVLNSLKQKNHEAEKKRLDENNKGLSEYGKKYEKEEKRILELIKKREQFSIEYITKIKQNTSLSTEQKLEEEAKFNESMSNLNKVLYDTTKKNNENRKKDTAAFIDESIKQHIFLFHKKRYLIEEEAALQKQQITTSYNKSIAEAKSAEEIQKITEAKNSHLLALDEDLKNKLNENSQKQLAETSSMVDTTISEITSRTTEFRTKGGKFLDIGLTKENIKATTEQLNEYKSSLEKSKSDQEAYYNSLEKLYQGDSQMLIQVQNEKKKVLEQSSANITKVEKIITETSKKENGLRLEQFKQYAEEAQKVTAKLKKDVEKNFEKWLKGLQNGLKVIGVDLDTTKYDEKISENEKKQSKYAERAKSNIQELDYLKQKQVENGASLTQEEIHQMTHLQSQIKKDFDEKKKLEDEQTKLEEKKKKADQIRKKFELGKKIVEATANVAEGVTKTLGAYPWPLNLVLATIVGTAGAIQIGIMTKQLAKFANGGLLNGKRHSQGGMRIEGTNIEVEGGEYVVNRESTGKNLGLVRYINSQRRELTPMDMNAFFAKASQGYKSGYQRMFEAGGTLPAVTAPGMSDDALVDAIKSIKFNFSPRVAVTDIIRAQEDAVQVNSWTGI